MTRLARWFARVGRWPALRVLGPAVALSLALAEAPLVYADPPLAMDPASCRPAAAATYLGLGSEAVVVVGHDDEGRCRIERFAEGEGAYTQLLCFVAADAPPAVWDPRDGGLPDRFVYQDACEVVDSGNLLLPGDDAEPVPFPLGSPPGASGETP